MSDLFVRIYDFFERRKWLFYTILTVITLLLGFFALKVDYSEQITNFFPDNADGRKQNLVFDNLKAKDRIVVMFTSDDPDLSIACGDEFIGLLTERAGEEYIRSVTFEVGGDQMSDATDLIYGSLPVYLADEDYLRLDSLLQGDGALDQRMTHNHRLLTSPLGMGLRDIVLQDPLGMATGKFAMLQDFAGAADYEIYDGHIFSSDMSVLLMIIDPSHGMGDTGTNENLISAIEESAEACAESGFGDVAIDYFGGPSVAVYNARQIKSDTLLTLSIALVIIILFILLAFRNRWAILLILTPVVFGAIFALGMIWLFGSGSISAIAIGAGAAVFGIALSYSIHVISHSNHTHDPRKIISELAYPLTVGSFTTIGAFLGLLFTQSQLLRDFGLFAALTLIGTTLFCLIFLPHFLKGSGKDRGESKFLKLIERINGYGYDRNKWLVGIVAVVVIVCMFFSADVSFDSDMMNLNYMPAHLQRAEDRLSALTREDKSMVIFASVAEEGQDAYEIYSRTNALLDTLKAEGLINTYTSAKNFLVSPSQQQERIDRWNEYWEGNRREEVISEVVLSGAGNGFRSDAFDGFARNLRRGYSPVLYKTQEDVPTMLENWVNVSGGMTILFSQVSLPKENKEGVYARFADNPDVIVIDRGYYANRMAQTINDDFYLTLFISSVLIFVALLVSYGRIELTLLAFMPMFVSWIIILGLMALFGIEFNIINIILSTFIFGIGDDFSIFIMDGLLTEYKTGRKLLAAHKTAIFFSAFTIIVGLGVLVLAKHPALRSVSVISILGILTVIVVSYVLQPVVFRWLITAQTRKGGFPFTLAGFLNTVYAFLLFLTGCVLLQCVILLLLPLPVCVKKKKLWFHAALSWSLRAFLKVMITTKRIGINEHGEDFKKPAVVIANHQSFIDILVMLSLNPKLVMVTNSWVWRSPFFGWIVRYGGFYHTAEGYGKLSETLREKVGEGYSVVVFPEGTRSADGVIKRFHKGAFYLAEKLSLDILPVVLYGNGMISSKRQPFYIKKGFVVSKILDRIAPSDTFFGGNYTERAKSIRDFFRSEYDKVCDEFGRSDNPWFFDALIKNYTYKGPVLEWYMRIKVRMERRYDFFDRLVPRDASIVDVGCGYGPLSYMLCLLSDRRSVLGIDYDEEKIALAAHNFSRSPQMRFVAADAARYDMPRADVFIINDVLHYMDYPVQDALLEKCLSQVAEDGMVIVRDGDASDAERHTRTERTERWSTSRLGFNKTENELCFTTSERIISLARKMGFETEITDNGGRTSNKIYIMRRKK